MQGRKVPKGAQCGYRRPAGLCLIDIQSFKKKSTFFGTSIFVFFAFLTGKEWTLDRTCQLWIVVMEEARRMPQSGWSYRARFGLGSVLKF